MGSKHLKGGVYRGLYRGVLKGVSKGDTRSLDYSSCRDNGKEDGKYYLSFRDFWTI